MISIPFLTRRRVLTSIALVSLGLGGWMGVVSVIGQSKESTVASNLNVPLPTMGGTQLWTDHVDRGGFRIQQNALTGHWRLIDAVNVRRGWGSREDVEPILEELCPQPPQPSDKPIVVLLHGLMRTSGSMKSLALKLQEAGYDQSIRFSYASTRCSLAQSAAALREVLEGQHPDAEFCFAGHSMGNIIVRHLVGDLIRDGDPKGILPRCKAMVMLGPPNQGAMIARRLGTTGVFEWVVGPGGMELGSRWSDVEPNLATPPFPFAVVAGHMPEGGLSNPLVDGASDFVVSLDEAKLDGAEEVCELPVLHSFLMSDADAQAWTASFFDTHCGEEQP